MREMDAIQKEGAINTVAWHQARATLRSMCLSRPNHIPYACEPRLVKMSNNPSTDDWQFVTLPPHQLIVDVHESTLRNARGSLRFYEDAMFALSHALAKRVDAGEITPEQFKLAWNEGWKWMYTQLQNDYALLQQNIILAKQADANTWQTGCSSSCRCTNPGGKLSVRCYDFGISSAISAEKSYFLRLSHRYVDYCPV
jgi:hypothetical protein